MRVLKTSYPKADEVLLRFEENFVPGKRDESGNKVHYAILSHAWEEEEVLYTDVIERCAESKKGYQKLESAIIQARRSGYEYLWADMACIDKRHSAELQEAINSMWSWYSLAKICLVYLADVPAGDDAAAEESSFVSSRWFRRGWTLQELIAPKPYRVEFFSDDWEPLGNRVNRSQAISRASGIDVDILEGRHTIETASIAKRFSWAARRDTTRLEDWAYCLLGLFSVAMPMLYGEGLRKAFLRLQEEIMRNSDDHSIFAWVDRSVASPATPHGLLADSPAAFESAGSVVTYSHWGDASAYAMTNRGLDIQLHLTPAKSQYSEQREYVAALHCPDPRTQSGFFAIRLRKLDQRQDQFVRIDCGRFEAVNERGQLMSVLVPQSVPDATAETVYPLHMFLLQPMETNRPFTTIHNCEFDGSDRRLLGAIPDRAFKIAKEERQWAAVIHIGHDGKEDAIAILLGTRGRFDVGFVAIEADSLESGEVRRMKENFDPHTTGETVHLRHQSVRVDMPWRATKGIKIYGVVVTIRGHQPGNDEESSPREPTRQVVNFAKAFANPSSQPIERPGRRDRFYKSMGLRK